MFPKRNIAIKLVGFFLLFGALAYFTIDITMQYCHHQKSEIITEQKTMRSTLKNHLSPKIADPIMCLEKDTRPKTLIRGDYWVLKNHILGLVTHKCNETITYTTHG